MSKFFLFVVSFFCLLNINAQTSVSPLDCVDPFYHGVASGDPLSDAVIIWTRVTPDDFTLPVNVSYTMATDTNMTNIVAQGSTSTDASVDYTVKFDVTGLSPDTYYYYEFEALGKRSATGRTKTAPVGAIDSLRFAIVSCANLEAGFFNVYQSILTRNDVEAVLMLGDYIYEYEEGGYSPNSNVDRIFDPTNETITLDDYRLRYSVYHMDRDLQDLHQNFPWICVWDDHESANDSYLDGAENHNAGEGLWADRKMAAEKAYFEWLPIREKAPNNYEIFRKFGYGDMLDLFMVDTRLHGREEQGVNESDPNRTMLGTDQYGWLTSELKNSTAQWKVLGNQVVFAPITVFGIPINNDAWDGYPAERQNLLDSIALYNVENFTVITGDIHTSWAFDIENGNSNAGVEFVTPSVTSPGIPINGGSILMIENQHLKFVELTKKGFVILDMNTQRIQADWYFINTIDNFNSPAYAYETSYFSNSGQMSLNETNSASVPGNKYDVPLAPTCPRGWIGIDENTLSVLGVYPNPSRDKVNLHFAGTNNTEHLITVLDLNGRVLFEKKTQVFVNNSNIESLDLSKLEVGTYLIKVADNLGNVSSTKFQKL
jgi:alkaline phosphatase D